MNLTTESEQSITWQQNRQLHLRCYTAWLEANPKPAMNQIITESEDPNTMTYQLLFAVGSVEAVPFRQSKNEVPPV